MLQIFVVVFFIYRTVRVQEALNDVSKNETKMSAFSFPTEHRANGVMLISGESDPDVICENGTDGREGRNVVRSSYVIHL